MLISEKQHAANKANAQHSSGPKTPEGREAIRFNALTFGLRTRTIILPTENAAAYSQLWDELCADFNPRTRFEMCCFETIVIAQWHLIRNANSENQIYQEVPFGERRLAMLAEVDKQRTKFEKEFRDGVDYLQKLQKQRPAKPEPEVQEQTAAPVEPIEPVRNADLKPHPGFVMSEPVGHPVFCAPDTTGTR